MGEANTAYLKQKCNRLIDKALQLERENAEADATIQQLLEKKKQLEERVRKIRLQQKQNEAAAEEEKKQDTKVSGVDIEPSVGEEEQVAPREEPSYYLITTERINKMIHELSEQMVSASREEIVVRNVSTGARIIELLVDWGGKIVKFIILGGLMVLLSMALTVLANGELRNTLIDFIRNSVG